MREHLENILQVCCDEFEVSIDDVRGKSRKQDLVYCRMAFVVIVKERFDLCNEKIGDAINRKHNNIHYLRKKHETNRFYNMVLSNIRNKLAK